jgi:hypothetical protein
MIELIYVYMVMIFSCFLGQHIENKIVKGWGVTKKCALDPLIIGVPSGISVWGGPNVQLSSPISIVEKPWFLVVLIFYIKKVPIMIIKRLQQGWTTQNYSVNSNLQIGEVRWKVLKYSTSFQPYVVSFFNVNEGGRVKHKNKGTLSFFLNPTKFW